MSTPEETSVRVAGSGDGRSHLRGCSNCEMYPGGTRYSTPYVIGGCPSGTTVTLDTTLIHYSNLKLLASFHHTPRTIRRALEFIEAGVIRAADFVDGECSLSRLPQLFQSMTAGNRVVKTLIKVKE